jgi:predicted acylesterase/phospholipase RssA
MSVQAVAFSAAGFEGFLHLGVLEALQEADVLNKTTRFVGTSAGSIIAAFAALGVKAKDVSRSIIERRLDFERIMDLSIIRFLETMGFSTGEQLFEEVRFYLDWGWRDGEAKTFAGLRARGKELCMFGTSLDACTSLKFDADTTPDMPLIDAIRISCSIPFLLPYCMHSGQICVDGAIMKYFPFDELVDVPSNDKLGICILGAERIPGAELGMYAYFCMLLAAALRLCPLGFNDEGSILKIKSKPEKSLPGAQEIQKMVTKGLAETSLFLGKRLKAKPD